jgi:ribosomal protein L7/L12
VIPIDIIYFRNWRAKNWPNAKHEKLSNEATKKNTKEKNVKRERKILKFGLNSYKKFVDKKKKCSKPKRGHSDNTLWPT